MKDIKATEIVNEDEVITENILRPKEIGLFVGQKKTVENLKIFIEAAKMRGEHLDHVLFYGPPGLGKTTLANIISNEINCGIFRHAVYKSNLMQIPPHENKINCDKLIADEMVYGCAKPFQIIKHQ